MKRVIRMIATGALVSGTALLGVGLAPSVAGASSNGTVFETGSPTSTTMDACSAFSAVQTSSQSHTVTLSNGTINYFERGTWSDLTQNWGSPVPDGVPSITNGTYSLELSIAADGSITGTEEFHSSEGNVAQQYSFDAVANAWTVNVVATGMLSFLTSNTNGDCY